MKGYSMSYQTTIPADKVNEAALIALAEQINILTRSKLISIEQQFVITTDDINLSSMLDSLVDVLLTASLVNAQATPTKKNGKAKATKKSAGITSHQVRIDATGETISTQAFNKRLKAGEVEELTNVTNAKGEHFVVIDSQLVKGPQS
jgi:hypothetical protein